MAGSPQTDSTVSGGTTYAYQVTGLDATGQLRVGALGLRPGHGDRRLHAAADLRGPRQRHQHRRPRPAASPSSWSAATPACAGPITYNVYRSTSSGFTPGPGNRIATGVTGTSYNDASGSLMSGTTYYYVVRAVDSSNGIEEGNTVQKSATPTGPIAIGNLIETFEGGGGFDNPGWTHNAIAGAVDWVLSTAQSQTPTHSWFSASQTTRLRPGPGHPHVRAAGELHALLLAHLRLRDQRRRHPCYDAGTLEISIDGGSTWSVVPDAAFTAGGFNGTVNTSFSQPDRRQAGLVPGHDRRDDAGQRQPRLLRRRDRLKLRWHEGDDSSAKATGWFVDSVTLANVGSAGTCTAANVLFNDGFESGDLSAWSSHNP